MKKRLALVLVLVLLTSAATTAFASPFADVPADHWAYDSVAELAAAGLIEGYPDGTYGGARMMTRYEAAMVFARALKRLESQIANNNILPELDKLKAELMAEIEAQMAAANKPVVETRVIETVQKDLDEEALARIRANEVATDALEGDMAYLEARMLGLIDGIRHDMSKLEEQQNAGVEQPSMDEIEALIAARVQEALLNVASGVKETTIVERVVSTTPELTRQDVELIAEALIRKQVQEVDRKVQENRDLIVGLVEWVDELDADVTVLKDDVAGLKTSVAKLEKSPVLSGTLEVKGVKESTKPYAFTQTGTLNLNIKASDTTNVKAILGYGVNPDGLVDTLSNYRVEVTSKTPVNKVVVGKLAKGDVAPYANRYVLKSEAYAFGGLAKINIVDGLTLDLFAGQKAVNVAGPVQAAAALEYKFMPEIGIRLAGALDKPVGAMFNDYAAGIGLFGTVASVTYGADFAMDFNATEKNYLGVATASAKFEPVTIDGKFVYQEENYKITNQLINELNRFSVEGGASAKLDLFGAGLTLSGRGYYEAGAAEVTPPAPADIIALKANASTTFDVGLPVTLAAQYVGNKTGDAAAEFKHHALASLSVAKTATHGLRYGASAAYEYNVLGATNAPATNWKNIANISDKQEARLGANVGYGVDWSGAKVDLDYTANFKMPLAPKDPVTDKAADMTLGHEVKVGYGFTKDVTLTLGATVDMTLADPLVNAFGYNAGLKVVF